MTLSPSAFGPSESGQHRLHERGADTPAATSPLGERPLPRRSARPGREIPSAVLQLTSSQASGQRFAAAAEEDQHIKPPAMPARLRQERGSPQHDTDRVSPPTVPPVSQSTGMVAAGVPEAEPGIAVSSLTPSPIPRHDAEPWTGFLNHHLQESRCCHLAGGMRPDPSSGLPLAASRSRRRCRQHLPPRARSAPRRPALSLDEYLKQRSEGRR